MRTPELKTIWLGSFFALFLSSAAHAEPLSKKSLDDLDGVKDKLENTTIQAPKRIAPAPTGQADAARRASEELDKGRSLRIQEEILRKLQ